MKHSYGILLKAIRKHYQITQVSLSSIIGVSQGALSKLESGSLELSSSQLILICNHFQISPFCFSLGYVNIEEKKDDLPTSKYKRGFKISETFLKEANIKVRVLIPVFEYIKKNYGHKKLINILKSLGVNYEYFIITNSSINYDFISSFLDKVVQEKLITTRSCKKIIQNYVKSDVYNYLNIGKKISIKNANRILQKQFDNGVEYSLKSNNVTLIRKENVRSKFYYDYLEAFINSLVSTQHTKDYTETIIKGLNI